MVTVVTNEIEITEMILDRDNDKWFDMLAWTIENIGPALSKAFDMPYILEGQGWRISSKHDGEGVKYCIEFDDDAQAVQYKLVWS